MTKTLTFSSDYNKLFVINEVDDSLKTLDLSTSSVSFRLKNGEVVIGQEKRPKGATLDSILNLSSPTTIGDPIVNFIIGSSDIVASLTNGNGTGVSKTLKYNLKDQIVFLSKKDDTYEIYTV